MEAMNFAMSYSGGKDSALAMYEMTQQGHTPVALITTVNAADQRSWFHGIPTELLKAVAESLRVPLVFCENGPTDYTEAFEKALKNAWEMGAEACAFGDIDIADHQAWDEERCASAGLVCVLPLWGKARDVVLNEMLAAGFKAVVKIVDKSKLDESFLGQTLTPALIEQIKAAGADACGEYGEYHTFVYDGPGFAHPVPFELGEVVDLGTHAAIDLKPID